MKTIGYISGTFDLFHIGHLNIIKKAKENCDYLIVGVHESGAWKGKDTFILFEERLAIVSALKYVDQVVKSYPNDTDAIKHHNIKKLFEDDVLDIIAEHGNWHAKFRNYIEQKKFKLGLIPMTDRNNLIARFPMTSKTKFPMVQKNYLRLLDGYTLQ